MAAFVTGDRALDRKLAELSAGAVKKVMKPAIAAGLRVSAKAMKAAVPGNMKSAKKAIGSRFNKSPRNGTVMAKAGAGVGMKIAKIRKMDKKNSERRGNNPGVGISARNIMWFILGTAQRFTGSKRVRSDKTGNTRKATGGAVHSTGRMPSQMNPIQEGFQRSESATMQKIVDTAKTKLAGLAK